MATAPEIPGVRVKIRRTESDLVATLWLDDEPFQQVLRAPLSAIGPAGSDAFHAFTDAEAAIVRQRIERVAPEAGMVGDNRTRRQRASGPSCSTAPGNPAT